MFAAALVPVVLFGLNWKGATKRAAIVSISFSLIMNLSIQVFSIQIPYGMSGGFLAILFSMILFIVVSLMDKPKPLPKDLDRILDM